MIQARSYHWLLEKHLRKHRQMMFVSGPRQVGKTTLVKEFADHYFNADVIEDRRLILKGARHFAAGLDLKARESRRRIVVFDEIHKIGVWKGFLKGFFDIYADQVAVMVTGSSRLDIYKRGGDSLMGRYLPYRIHPFSVGELANPDSIPKAPGKPKKIPERKWKALLDWGGYPEPLLKGDPNFARTWRRLRMDRLVKGDLRDLSGLRELGQIEVLAKILDSASGTQLVYSNLASEISTSIENVKRWIHALSSLHLGFLVRPWHRNVRRSLRKEPKWFLRDWSSIKDPGARAETMAACHLLKSVDAWNDLGVGEFALHYVRDKEKREVDFLLVRNEKPWVLIEVKAGSPPLSESLGHFHSQLGTQHALQLNFGDPFDGRDGFSQTKPMALSARSFFSQIV